MYAIISGKCLLRSLELTSFLLLAFAFIFLSEDNALKFTCLVNSNLCLGVTFCISESCLYADMLERGLVWVVLSIATFKPPEKISLKQVSFAQISGAGLVHQIFQSPCLLSCILAVD